MTATTAQRSAAQRGWDLPWEVVADRDTEVHLRAGHLGQPIRLVASHGKIRAALGTYQRLLVCQVVDGDPSPENIESAARELRRAWAHMLTLAAAELAA